MRVCVYVCACEHTAFPVSPPSWLFLVVRCQDKKQDAACTHVSEESFLDLVGHADICGRGKVFLQKRRRHNAGAHGADWAGKEEGSGKGKAKKEAEVREEWEKVAWY